MRCKDPPAPFQFKDLVLLGKCFRVHDGDSFRALVIYKGDLTCLTIRLGGVDCPEISAARGTLERRIAEKAKAFVQECVDGKIVTLRLLGNGKYAGRVLADVTLEDGSDLANLLVKSRLAFTYDGGRKRKDWRNL